MPIRRTVLLLALALTAAILPGTAFGSPVPLPLIAEETTAESTAHPRLLFSAADVAGLRARVAMPGVPATAWAMLRERSEGHLLKVHADVVRANPPIPRPTTDIGAPYTLQNEMPTYLIDLGMAYQLSGDERYGRRVIDLLLALGDAGYPYWCCQDLGIGDLLEGIGLGFDWTYQLMTPAERSEIVADLARYEQELFGRMLVSWKDPPTDWPKSNWMGVTAGGAGLALLAIRGEPGAPAATEDYLALASQRVQRFFQAGTDLMGAYSEGVQYSGYGIKNSVPYAVAARRAGLGNLFDGTGMPNMARWLAYEQLPGEGQNFVPLNTSGRPSLGPDLMALQFAIDPDNGIAQWLWERTLGPKGDDFYNELRVPDYVEQGACTQNRLDDAPVTQAGCLSTLFNGHGNVWTVLFYRTLEETPEIDPATTAPLSVWHKMRGLVDARTGFAGNGSETVSTFEAHRDGMGHFQYDVGNFTLYGQGGRFAVDPGFFCVACGKTGDDAGYATGHNVVVVDGQRETQHASLRYFKGTTIDDVVNTPTGSLTHADLRYVYSFDAPVADRDHFFGRSPGRPVIVGIGDSLQRDKDGAAGAIDHAYTWQMLTEFKNRVARDGSGFTVTSPKGATVVGRAAVDGSESADLPFQQREYVYTNQVDDLVGAHVLYTTTPRQKRFDQLTVLALTPAGEAPATQTTLRVAGGNAIAVDWHGGRDVLVRRLASSPAVSGPVATDAVMAKYTRGVGDTVLRKGTHLVGEGQEYVDVVGSAATVTVSAGQVTAVGAAGNVYRVFAPQPIEAVTLNGAPATSCRAGDYVTFPCRQTTELVVSAPATGSATDELPLSATLTSGGQPLPGRPVTFTLGRLSATAITDASGVAQLRLPLHTDPATYLMQASFAGDTQLAPSSASTPVDVIADTTALGYTGQTVGRGETVEVSAVLLEDDQVPLEGQPVTFTLNGLTATARTDAAGRAAATMPVPDHGRVQTVSVRYAGAARYAASAATGTIIWGNAPL